MATSAQKFSSGYKGKKVRKKRTSKPPASRQSGGTSGDLTVKGHEPKTPVRVDPDYTSPEVERQVRGEQRRDRKLKKARKKTARATARGLQILEDLDLPDPHFESFRAKTEGRFPSEELRKKYPLVSENIERQALDRLSETQGLKDDPIAEFAISSAATLGVGTGAKALGTAIERGLAARASSEVAETAAEKAPATARSLLRNPKRAGQALKKTPAKVKAAPKRAKKAVRTKEGRRKLQQGEARRVRRAGERAKRKPVRYSGGANVAAVPLGAESDASQRANALVTGTAKGFYENPVGFTEATGRGIIGMATGPLALGRAGLHAALTGDTAPLEKTATQQYEGTVDLAGKLLSGDEAKVQKTVEEETGISYALPAPALSRLKVVKKAKGKVREGAASARRKVADATGWERVRVAPDGADTHVLAPMERRAARRRVAQQVTRETAPARNKAAYHQRRIEKALRKAKKTRSLRNLHGMEAGDLLATLAEYGIRTLDDVKFVREHGPTGEGASPSGVTLAAALDFAEKNPKVLSDKHLRKALDAYIESTRSLPAAKAGKGRRAKVMAQGDLFGVIRPEDRVPVAAREHTSATTRAEAWRDAATREKEIKAIRKEARTLADQAQVAKGAEREALRRKAEAKYKDAKAKESVNAELVKALGKYSRPGQALRASGRRRYYDDDLLKEYEAEVAAAREGQGLAEPAWVSHQELRQPGEIAPSYPTAASRVQHMRSGALAAEDRVDRSLRALMSGSVVGPRLREGAQALARRFTEREMLPVKVGDANKYIVTKPEWTKAIKEGQYSPRHYVLFPARQFKQAVLDPFRSQEDIASVAGKALEQSLRQESPGEKYVVVRREAAKEFKAQISPEHWAGEVLVNAASKGVSRWLLFSPAWAMIQTVAEAVPMVMAHPELLNPVKIAKLERALRKNAKLNPEEARAFAAVAGEAPTALQTPNAFRPELGSNPHGVFSDGARALTKSKLGQALFSVARLRPFGVFDAWRQGRYRELLMAAEADKRLNTWTADLKSMLHIERRLSDELRHLPLDQQIAALTKPKYRDKLDELQAHVEGIAGNWQSFTRFERSFAPFLVFYPFIRYSLRWPLTFAKHHPVAAEVAVLLGQQNAEQIEKILGHAPSNPLEYAIPVWTDAEGEQHMALAGMRAAPGLSAPTQAVLSGEPSQALSAFNPIIGASISGATGVDAYTGRQEAETAEEKGVLFANQLLATSPILRYFDVQVNEEETPADKRVRQLDPDRRARSLYAPWEDMTAERYAALNDFGDDLSLKYSDPIPSIWDNPEVGEAVDAARQGHWGKLKKLLKQHRASEAAADRIEAQEEQFFEGQDWDDMSPLEEDRVQKAMELAQEGILIHTEPKKKARKIKDAGAIGGRPLGGSIGGGSIGGGSLTGGRIGGRPLNR